MARSLGAPAVCVRPRTDRPAVVAISVMWELSWYRFEVDLSDEGKARGVVDAMQNGSPRVASVERKERLGFTARDFEIVVPLPPFLDELRGGNRLGKTGLQRARKRTHGLSRLP